MNRSTLGPSRVLETPELHTLVCLISNYLQDSSRLVYTVLLVSGQGCVNTQPSPNPVASLSIRSCLACHKKTPRMLHGGASVPLQLRFTTAGTTCIFVLGIQRR